MASKSSHIDKLNRANREQEERLAQQRKSQATELHTLDCFHTIPIAELEHLVDICLFRTFLANETLISEGKENEFFFVLLQGGVSLAIKDKNGQPILLEVLNRGDCFGEGTLFSHFRPRTTAIAQTACYTLQLPLVDMRSVLYRSPTLGDTLYRTYLRRLVESKLACVPVFREISLVDRLSLAAELQPVCYARGNLITQQGAQNKALYIIDSGHVVVEQDTLPIALLGEGDFFGEIALMENQPHTASVRALTPVNILVLEATSCHKILAHYPDLQHSFQIQVDQHHANDLMRRKHTNSLPYVQLVLQHGLFRGTHLLVRKPHLCPPDCQICIQACAKRHGNARLRINREVSLGEYEVLDACRQCRFGAECEEACPEQAFAWDDSHVLLITDSCTGCGDCVAACPYQMIARVPRTHYEQSSRFQKLHNILLTLFHTSIRSTNQTTTSFTHRADKCDLCHGYADLACVSACPNHCISLEREEDILALQPKSKPIEQKGTNVT